MHWIIIKINNLLPQSMTTCLIRPKDSQLIPLIILERYGISDTTVPDLRLRAIMFLLWSEYKNCFAYHLKVYCFRDCIKTFLIFMKSPISFGLIWKMITNRSQNWFISILVLKISQLTKIAPCWYFSKNILYLKD